MKEVFEQIRSWRKKIYQQVDEAKQELQKPLKNIDEPSEEVGQRLQLAIAIEVGDDVLEGLDLLLAMEEEK